MLYNIFVTVGYILLGIIVIFFGLAILGLLLGPEKPKVKFDKPGNDDLYKFTKKIPVSRGGTKGSPTRTSNTVTHVHHHHHNSTTDEDILLGATLVVGLGAAIIADDITDYTDTDYSAGDYSTDSASPNSGDD